MTDGFIENPSPREFRVDWSCVLRNVRIGMAIVGAFAIGGWVTSIRVQEQRLPYLMKATAKQEQLQAIAGPNPLATIKCERRRADVAERVADQAVAISDMAVSAHTLPRIPDCPVPSASAQK